MLTCKQVSGLDGESEDKVEEEEQRSWVKAAEDQRQSRNATFDLNFPFAHTKTTLPFPSKQIGLYHFLGLIEYLNSF